MPNIELPPLPLESWRDTKTTLHLFSQIIGKIRLGLGPRYNHWWHVPLYVCPRGLTTSNMPTDDGSIEIVLDLIDHEAVICRHDGETRRVPLRDQSVAGFYGATLDALRALGVDLSIISKPFDPQRVGSDTPFDKDTVHHHYDAEYVSRFHRILLFIEPVFREFRGRFVGKCSPVHFFWHSFDLAVTRFSGKAIDVSPDADPVTREAYSHEVISHGFWVGDDNLPEPAFYSYTHPEPASLGKTTLQPQSAFWFEQNGGSMAILKYEDIRRASDPRAAIGAFLQSSYEAGADLAGWPRTELELS